MRIVTPPSSVNLTAFESEVLQHLLQALLVGDDRRRHVRADDLDRELEALVLGERPERALDVVADVAERDRRPACTSIFPASTFERSRMSLIRPSRSAPAWWIVVRELDLLLGEVLIGVLRQQLREDEQRVQRRAQLVAHVREELALVLRRERELLRALLQRGPRELDLAVLDLDAAVLLLEQLRLLLELLVRLLELLLLRLQQLLGRLERLRLLLELGVRALQLLLLRLELLRALLQLDA